MSSGIKYDPAVGEAALERVTRNHNAVLTDEERMACEVARFVAEFELGGLSGYFFNTQVAIDKSELAASAFARYGFDEIASTIRAAAGLFRRDSVPEAPKVWNSVLASVDPKLELPELNERLVKLLESFESGLV